MYIMYFELTFPMQQSDFRKINNKETTDKIVKNACSKLLARLFFLLVSV